MGVSVNNPNTSGVVTAPHSGATTTNPTSSGEATTSNAGVVIPTGLPGPPGPQGDPGPTGPEGPPGDPGAGSYYEEFNFAAPSEVWTIVHNQNSYGVTMETVDTNGDPIEGYERSVDLNTVEVLWYYPTAGTARVFR